MQRHAATLCFVILLTLGLGSTSAALGDPFYFAAVQYKVVPFAPLPLVQQSSSSPGVTVVPGPFLHTFDAADSVGVLLAEGVGVAGFALSAFARASVSLPALPDLRGTPFSSCTHVQVAFTDTITVTPTAPTSFGNVVAPINFDISGNLLALEGGEASVEIRGSLNPPADLRFPERFEGSLFFSGGAPSTLDSMGILTGFIPGSLTRVSTPPLNWLLGQPKELLLQGLLDVCAGGIAGDSPVLSQAVANFGHTISFATDRPVLDLPPGFTANSASGAIINNRFVALQETAPPPMPPIADLVVASGRENGVLRFDKTTGNVLGAFVRPGAGGLTNPTGLASGRDGYLYVSSFGTGEVLKYDGNTGEFLGVFIEQGTGGIGGPGDLLFGPDGNLYVINSFFGANANKVLRFDPMGNFPGVFADVGAIGGVPEDLTFGPDGDLYVLTTFTHQVLRFDGASGAFMDVFVDSGPLTFPAGIAFGPDGHLYVGNNDTSVRSFSGSTGDLLGLFVLPGSGGLNTPSDLTFGPEGNLYVTGFQNDAVLRYDGRTGDFIDVFASGVGGPSSLLFRLQASQGLNNRPTANAGADQTVNEGELVTLDGSGSGDSDGDPLTYQWTQITGTPVLLDLSDPVHPTFIAPAVPRGGETLTFQLTVSDGELTSDPDTVNITVKDVNHAPVAEAGDDQTVQEGSPVTLDGSASFDLDGDSLTYSWVQSAGPAVSLSGANTATLAFTAPFVGSARATLTFELTVSDGVASASDTVDVLVENVNHPPIADAGPDQIRDEGSLVQLDGTASRDPDGDPLTFTWSQLSGTPVALSDPHSATPTFTAPLQPSHGQESLTFQLTVEDGLGGRATDQMDITVLDLDAPPACELAQASPALLWPPDHKLLSVAIVGVADPDNDQVTLTVMEVTQDEPLDGLGDGDTSPDAVVRGATVLLRAERAGAGNGRVYQVSFMADDGSGGRCTGVVSVCMPHDRKAESCVDDGQQYRSTQP